MKNKKKFDPQELLDSLQGKADDKTIRKSLELFKKSIEVLDAMDKLVILHLKTHGCCKINTDCQQLGEQLFKLKEPVIREMCIYSPSGNLEKDFIKDWNRKFLNAWRKANMIVLKMDEEEKKP